MDCVWNEFLTIIKVCIFIENISFMNSNKLSSKKSLFTPKQQLLFFFAIHYSNKCYGDSSKNSFLRVVLDNIIIFYNPIRRTKQNDWFNFISIFVFTRFPKPDFLYTYSNGKSVEIFCCY